MLMILGLVACGSKSVEGKWVFGANYYEFKKDGTFTSSFNGIVQNGTYTASDGKMTLTYKNMFGIESTTDFTYTLKGKTLSLTGDVSLLGGMSMTVDFTK